MGRKTVVSFPVRAFAANSSTSYISEEPLFVFGTCRPAKLLPFELLVLLLSKMTIKKKKVAVIQVQTFYPLQNIN